LYLVRLIYLHTKFGIERETQMTQSEFHEMQLQEQRLEAALEKVEHGDFLTDDEVSIIHWACGKSRKPRQSFMRQVFEDWSDVYKLGL